MPSAQPFFNDQLESAEVKSRTVKCLLTIKTAATAGSVTITCDNPAVVPYWVASGTAPSDANFPSLTNTSNSIIGLYINDGGIRAYRFGKATNDAFMTPSITVVKIEGYGLSSTTSNVSYGATSTTLGSANGALGITLTGCTLVATATTQLLGLDLEFWQF